jgi:hypothetical protein
MLDSRYAASGSASAAARQFGPGFELTAPQTKLIPFDLAWAAPATRAAARAAAARFFNEARGKPSGPVLIVRANARDSGETDADLGAVMAGAPDATLFADGATALPARWRSIRPKWPLSTSSSPRGLCHLRREVVNTG